VQLPRRPDDPRLGETVQVWSGEALALRGGQPVLIGFPQDEGVRRNGGRPGAAQAPGAIRHWLYRLMPWDPQHGFDLAGLNLADLGDVRCEGGLEQSQAILGEVTACVLEQGAIPIVLGGGHETAYGFFLGHVRVGRPIGIINLDAHLDVRPTLDGLGHSGSPFRQAIEHPDRPLPGECYVCLGAQPFAVSRQHADWLRERGGVIGWRAEVQGRLVEHFRQQAGRLGALGCRVHVSLDADVAVAAEVPGVSAPNPLGLSGAEIGSCLLDAGTSPAVASLEVVEINPTLDPDGLSARWAAVAVWSFLAGLAKRAQLSTRG
jgi:formiminoglutamase